MNAHLYSKLYQILKNGMGAVLIRIVHRAGSAPRGVGSICIVDEEGTLYGTIGGGILEFRAMENAKVLLKKRVTSLATFNMTADEVASEGMICGGKVELYYEPILPEDKNTMKLYHTIDELVQGGKTGTLVTLMKDGTDASAPDNRMLVTKNGRMVGNISSFELPEHVIQAQQLREPETKRTLFLEPISQEPTLMLFGGGHISTFVSPIAKMLGFQVCIFDDRIDFANKERFPEADEIYAVPYSEAVEKNNITAATYIVIVTRGHAGDRDVLELLLKSKFSPAYIGMIGSTRKRDTIYTSLMENGTSRQTLERIHCPIGLNIGAHTPEEIAVSIMAEIVQVKANGE